MKYLLFIVILLLTPVPCLAQDGLNLHLEDSAVDNYVSECTYCAAFFTHTSICLAEVPGNKEFADAYALYADELLMSSYMLANYETTETRLNLADQEIFNRIEGKCENLSLLMSADTEKCLELYQNNMDETMRVLGFE